MPALQWLRLIMNHISDKNEHLVHYFGYYSDRCRGARQTAEQDDDIPLSVIIISLVDEPGLRGVLLIRRMSANGRGCVKTPATI